jgi:flagellar motor switch protein FliN
MTEVPDASSTDPSLEVHSGSSSGFPSEIRLEIRNWCDAWNTGLQNVLSQESGEPIVFEVSFEPLPAADNDVWYTVVAGGAVRGEMTLRVPASSGGRLAQKFSGESAPVVEPASATEQSIPGKITSDQNEALEKLLRQTSSLTASALAATAGGEVQLHLSPSAAPSWSSDAIVCLRSRNGDDPKAAIAMEIQLSPALAAALMPRTQVVAASLSQSASSSPPPSSASGPPASSYRRLMDVGLNVKLRFGTRRMLLRDVLALSAGVVIELDNHLQSPVDLLLDDRLIAQGEVVIVDGKYGLRVTDVVDPATAVGSAP